LKEIIVKRIVIIIFSLVILVMLWEARAPILSAMAWFGDQEAVASSMQRIGFWGPLVLFLLFVFQVFLAFIPGQALMVACGYLYGFWGGFLISWLSLVAGGELAFVLVRKYGRPFAERWVSPEILSRWDRAAKGQGIAFYSVMFVMPLVPNDAMSYVAGLGSISHRRFTIANFLGRGVACAFTSAAGALGGRISGQGWMIIIALFVIIGVAWYIIRSRKLPSPGME
jgi:uncharacterized membrane protein YdjX (TVP38/TMEM64 family)